MARSLKKHHSEIHFVLLIVEPNLGISNKTKKMIIDVDQGKSFDEIITLDDLDLRGHTALNTYTVVELCTAVKGQATVQLLARETSEFVTYLDPDLYFYDSLIQVQKEHTDADVLLTPHLNHVPHLNQTIINDEIAGVLRHGVFNLGFVSFKNTKNGRQIAAWWADRLQISSKADYHMGLFTDQKWWDLSQTYFTGTRVIKNDGWNMAPWNISERRLSSINPPVLDSSDPLLFFHFSKFPTTEFSQKIKTGTTSKFLEILISDYAKEFTKSQVYVEEMMAKIEVQSGENRTLIPKRKPKYETLLSKFLNILVKSSTLRRLVSEYKTMYKLAKYMYSLIYKQIYRIDIAAKSDKIILDLDQVNLDILIITHKGGGGVSEVIDKRLYEFMELGKKVGIIRPDQAGNFFLTLNFDTKRHNVSERLNKIIARSHEIEIHHMLGFENQLTNFLDIQIDRLFLHDRYFITQLPFSDAKPYLPPNLIAAGISRPLNENSKILEIEWLEYSRVLLKNSKQVYAPSDYLKNEFKKTFPDVSIQRFIVEPKLIISKNFKVSQDRQKVIIISPTSLHKGSSVVEEVATILNEVGGNTVFDIYGDLEITTEEKFKKLINLNLIGQVSRNRLNHALANSSGALGWIPSLTGESYSLALSDFLSNGVTVIAPKSGALTERLIQVPGNYIYNPSVPSQVLSEIILALLKNTSIEKYKDFVELT